MSTLSTLVTVENVLIHWIILSSQQFFEVRYSYLTYLEEVSQPFPRARNQ